MKCPDGLNNTLLLQGYVFENGSQVGVVQGTYILRTGGANEAPPIAWVQL